MFLRDEIGFPLEWTGELTHGLPFKRKSQGVMDQSVENRIGQRWILNFGMPLVDGELGGQQAGGAAIAVIEEVEDVPGVIGGEGIAEPFI